MRWAAPVILALAVFGAADRPNLVTLSILGTTDLHGFAFPREGRGGVAALAGYVNNVRAARAADGGAVLLVDSGDTFQGGIESDLSEGALVVDAYNALGYSAAAIGNHEFEFGSVDLPGARQSRGDARGALKARAAQATFPFLAANLIDDLTGRAVEWPNVRPSAIVEAAGVKVGLVGVMTIEALRATLPVYVHGLRVAPLADTIAAEASALRSAGAQVVVVLAHAGGGCASFADPADLSSCDRSSEIFDVARSLPHGLVDVIAAGHTHDGLAHQVEGIAIVQGYALGRSFGRADVRFDRRTSRVVGMNLFAPHDVCARPDAEASSCESEGASSGPRIPEQYEGREVKPDAQVVAAMAPALQRVRDLQATPLGVFLNRPLRRVGDGDSPLGNLFADALREQSGADVAFNNNVRGGLRADLPEGPLTFGRLYDVFPFDNRLVRLTLTGAELRRLLADEIRRNRRGALGISGIRVQAGCSANGLVVDLAHTSGRAIADEERLTVVAMDSLVSGPVFASVANGVVVSEADPVLREVVEDWLRLHPERLKADSFVDFNRARWELSETLGAGCASH